MIRRAFPQQAVRAAAGKQEVQLILILYIVMNRKWMFAGLIAAAPGGWQRCDLPYHEEQPGVQPQERVVERLWR